MTDLMVIEQQGVRLVTTATLAEQYGTDTNTITQNFKRNKERYEEGKHYICLKGEELRAFKSEMTNCHFAKNLNVLYLWTEHGILLHAKSLNTDKAWEAYEKLIDVYFRAKKAETALQELSPQLQLMIKFETEQNALKAKVGEIERRLDSITAEPEPPKPKKLIPTAKKWSERELDYLRKAYALGQTDVEIAAELGRTERSVRSKRWRAGLIEVPDNARRHWSRAEDRKLERYVSEGYSAREIAAKMHRSMQGVQSRKSRLGLTCTV